MSQKKITWSEDFLNIALLETHFIQSFTEYIKFSFGNWCEKNLNARNKYLIMYY